MRIVVAALLFHVRFPVHRHYKANEAGGVQESRYRWVRLRLGSEHYHEVAEEVLIVAVLGDDLAERVGALVQPIPEEVIDLRIRTRRFSSFQR